MKTVSISAASTHARTIGRPAILTACLMIAAFVLPNGQAAQATSLAQEDPPSHVPFDRPFDLPPYLDAVRAPAPVLPGLIAPEYANWSKIVFQSARNRSDWEIYSARGDGSEQVNLSNRTSMDIHPRLSPDTTRVAFASNRSGDYDVFVMNRSEGDATRLTDSSGDDVYPTWSPDGTKIAYQSEGDGQAEIYVMNANGSNPTRLTNYGDYDGQPAWSPDGTKIAYVRRSSGQYRIWVMDANGANARQLSGQANSESPAWSPNGATIAFDADGNGDGWQEIWLMDASGANQRQVYVPPVYQTDAWVRSWSPDGRYVAFTAISWFQQGGTWYWTQAYLDAWDSTDPASTIRLSTTGLDWHPDWRSTDLQAPASNVQALPDQSPAAFTVRWSGADAGGSGLKSFDVQVRDGAGGTWTNLRANTAETSAGFGGIGGHSYFFRSRARDTAGNLESWPSDYDATTTVEALAPASTVQALPAVSRRQVLVRWTGADSGGSGILDFDVQVRSGDGAWTDWLMATTNTSALFSGPAGVQHRFRVRARDRAQNLEAWPASADASTLVYNWAIGGQVTDNRGVPVVNAELATVPAAFQVSTDGGEGVFQAYVAGEVPRYTAAWSKTPYGALPATAYLPAPDPQVHVVLPPADNVVQNWGFESGAGSWQFGGGLIAAASDDDKHSGAFAAFLGSPAHPLQSVAPLGEPFGPLRRPFDVAADRSGVFHSAWAPADEPVLVSSKPVDGPWSPPSPLPGLPTVHCWGLDLNADDAGSTHLVMATTGGVYYAYRAPGAGWSSPELIPGSSSASITPAIAVSSNGTLKIIVSGPGLYYNDVYFVERRPSAGWTTVRKIAETYGMDEQFRVAVDPAGLAHLLWNGGDVSGYADFLYISQKADGSWTTPINLSHYHTHPGDAAMAIDSQGTVHVLWSTDGIYHRMQWADGAWSVRQKLAPAEVGGVSLVVDDRDHLHAAWGDTPLRQVRYARGSNGVWSEPVGVSAATAAPSQSAPEVVVDRRQRVHVLWLQYEELNDWSIHYSRQTENGGWLPDVAVYENNSDTLRPHLLLDAHETAYAMWNAYETSAYRMLTAGPEPAQVSGEATMSQSIQVPAAGLAPTLSFLHRFSAEFPSATRLEVAVDDGVSSTAVFSATTGADMWTHQWVDLAPWAGRTVTLAFRVVEAAGGSHAWAYVDEVTVGSAYPDPWVDLPYRQTARPGQRTVVALSYGNRGGGSATNGQVTLQLPAELAFVSADPPPAATTPELRWDAGVLAGHSPAQTIRVTLQVAASALPGATLPAMARIASDTPEAEQANNADTGAIYVGGLSYLPLVSR